MLEKLYVRLIILFYFYKFMQNSFSLLFIELFKIWVYIVCVFILFYNNYVESCFYTPTLHQLVSEQGQVPTMAQRGACGGRPVAIDDVYERDEVARDAQLEAFFQRTEEWFDTLSKQLTALAIENRPQNYHPNSRYVEGEYFGVEKEDDDIKKEDEYIERVCVVNWDSPTIIGWYNQFVQKQTSSQLMNKVSIY